MNLVVFGATGKTGRFVVEQALAQGHTVTAFVRNPALFGMKSANLRVVQGDITDTAAVSSAVAGQDAVISVLGPVKGSPPDLMQTAARNLVAAMQQQGVRRIIYLTGAGVTEPKDPPSFASRVMVPLMKVVSGAVLKDSEAGVRTVQASNLDWTIVRGPRLGMNPPKGEYKHGYIVAGFAEFSRADLADFILKQMTSREYVQEAPIVAY